MKKIIFVIVVTLLIGACHLTDPVRYEELLTLSYVNTSIEKTINSSTSGNFHFVKDLYGYEENNILITFSDKIELMNLDGSNRRTIIDNIEEFYDISNDDSKILFKKNGLLHVANVDGTGIQNIIENQNGNIRTSHFSPNSEKVIYVLNDTNNTFGIWEKEIDSGEHNELISYDYNEDDYFYLDHPYYINDNEILYEYFHKNNKSGLRILNIETGSNEFILLEDPYYLQYDDNFNNCILKYDDRTVLMNLDSMQQTELKDSFFKFSPAGNYLYRNLLIYSIHNQTYNKKKILMHDFDIRDRKIIGIKLIKHD